MLVVNSKKNLFRLMMMNIVRLIVCSLRGIINIVLIHFFGGYISVFMNVGVFGVKACHISSRNMVSTYQKFILSNVTFPLIYETVLGNHHLCKILCR